MLRIITEVVQEVSSGWPGLQPGRRGCHKCVDYPPNQSAQCRSIAPLVRRSEEDYASDGFEESSIDSVIFVGEDEGLVGSISTGKSLIGMSWLTCLQTMPPRLWQTKMIGRGCYFTDAGILASGNGRRSQLASQDYLDRILLGISH